MIELFIRNFGVNSEGYVDLSVGSFDGVYGADHDGYFLGLSAGGNEEWVSSIMTFEHYVKTEHKKWFPLSGYLEYFLVELFAKMPLSDIIISS